MHTPVWVASVGVLVLLSLASVGGLAQVTSDAPGSSLMPGSQAQSPTTFASAMASVNSTPSKLTTGASATQAKPLPVRAQPRSAVASSPVARAPAARALEVRATETRPPAGESAKPAGPHGMAWRTEQREADRSSELADGAGRWPAAKVTRSSDQASFAAIQPESPAATGMNQASRRDAHSGSSRHGNESSSVTSSRELTIWMASIAIWTVLATVLAVVDRQRKR